MYKLTYTYLTDVGAIENRLILCARHLEQFAYILAGGQAVWENGLPMFGRGWKTEYTVGECDACREEAANAALHPMEAK